MSEHLIRLYQSQHLCGSVDVHVEADTAAAAMRIALDAAAGDPDDETGERRYELPDGRRFRLDPEDQVVGGEIWAEIIVDGLAGRAAGVPVQLDLDHEQALALSILLHRAIATCSDERVASLYDSMTQRLPNPPDEACVVPTLPAAIPVWPQEDKAIHERSRIRTSPSSPVAVAVLHDGSPAAFGDAVALADSLGVAIALAIRTTG